MNRRKWLGIVLAMVLSLSSLFQGFGTPANAQGTGKEVDATITDFHIESPKGTTVTEINTNGRRKEERTLGFCPLESEKRRG